jgi:5-methylcytosine-specific restriction endonuclease McrA
MSANWRGGSTSQWRVVRKAVLVRDHYLCRLRLAGCTHRAVQVHHVHGRSVTGDDPLYLVASCRECNLKLGEPVASPKPLHHTQW